MQHLTVVHLIILNQETIYQIIKVIPKIIKEAILITLVHLTIIQTQICQK